MLYDLDVCVDNGEVTTGHRAEAIIFGDTHVANMDLSVKGMSYTDDDSMMKVLRPKFQFLHDVFDGRSVNPHVTKGGLHHQRYRDYVENNLDPEKELLQLGNFLHAVKQQGTTTFIVNSNHDEFLARWLRDSSYKHDPKTAMLFLEAELYMHKEIARGWKPALLQFMVDKVCKRPTPAVFLAEDQSLIICPDANGGIECGMHGHKGPNGSRGSLISFARMGRKCVFGHSHTAGQYEAATQVGHSGKVDQGYNVGPDSWSWTHCVVYNNAKRALITMYANKWRGK